MTHRGEELRRGQEFPNKETDNKILVEQAKRLRLTVPSKY